MKGLIRSFVIFCSILSVSDAAALISQELDTVVVTATRLEEEGYKVAGNVTIITEEQIKRSNAQNVPDILKEALGVLVYDKSTVKTTTVDIRGFGDTASRNVLVLVDGRRVNSPDISGPDLIQVPIGAIERIEIIRGAGSVLYGDNAVGGVINIITKRGEGDASGRVGGTYGSYDRQGTDVEVSGKQKGLSYSVYSKYLDDRGYRTNSDVLTKDFNTRLGYEFSEHLSTDLHVGYHEDDYGLPGGLSLSEINSLGRDGSADPNDFASTEDRYIKLGLDITPWVDDEYKGDLVIDLYYRNRDVYDSFNSFGSYNTKRSTDTKGLTAKYIFDHTIFNRDVNFVTGLDYYDYENDITGSGSNSDVLTISKEEYGLFGFLQYEFMENVYVNGGTRYQKAKYTFNQTDGFALSPPFDPVFTEQEPDEFVSMSGIKYEYGKGSNVHLNYQETFRFLSTDEWYSYSGGLNTNLRQQTGYQLEMGVKHNFNDSVLFSVTPYYIELNNEIFLDPTAGGGFGDNANYDKTERLGIELSKKVDILNFFEMESEFFDALDFFVNYTYQHPQFSDGANDGNDIPMVPRRQSSHGFTAKFLKYYNVSIVGRYVGSRYAINDVANATGRHESYYVVDGKVSFEHDNFEIFASLSNLGDEQYTPLIVKSASGPAKDFFPAPEANYLVGVNIKF